MLRAVDSAVVETPTRHTLMQTGIATRATAARTAHRSWICRVLAEGRPAVEVALGARPIVVGADRRCDLVLEDAQVSRRHAELQVTPEGVRVRDLGSTNGTWWQGSRIADAVVPSGASIKIGDSSLRLLPGEAPTLPPSERTRFGGLVGRSLAMRELFAVLELAAPTDATVLVEGESGTGKELVARAVHDHSPRARVPLVVVDCSALTDTLLDSHLFGHVRGAFTGAATDRKGAFVEADGGTVFLDEIGELPLTMQTKLLRVLEARTVQPLGSDRPVSVDTRVVAATHRNLAEMVDRKEFRFDLYYRLAVVHVQLPPLRDRLDDLALLIQHFYEGRGVDPGPIAGERLDQLAGHAWPGNVRELRNLLERAWALSPPGTRFADLRLWMQPGAPAAREPDGIDTSLPFKEAKERWIDQFERRYLARVFEQHGGNITRAAEHAGINRRHLRELLHKHGIISE